MMTSLLSLFNAVFSEVALQKRPFTNFCEGDLAEGFYEAPVGNNSK